ncbi:ssDNA endonuclease and repair protein rad10 [Aspergillus nanangensis]|uniref:SsDNA endonuclease and repair protein rad10 n=1 Tax=Aspergillus nanangensis TaxID=2582783 RepID=A0AAD4CJD5_ASPNN|nr:ssDNA endonuclease and repair protein rad10 [Aspergillus nanangensis]
MVEDLGNDADLDTVLNAPKGATIRVPERPASATPMTPKVQQPKPQALASRSGPSAILVSTRQKGNPILEFIKLVPWEYADIPADYVVGATTCALFLSLKYHRLHPEYIYSRIRQVAGKYLLRVLLIMVDISNHEDSLKELSKTAIINNLTIVLCWSSPEAAHYLELFKSSEKSQPTAIRTQQAQTYKESLVEFVTTPRSINKSDAASLISTFGSLQNAVNAQPEQISSVPGWGEKKVRQWCNAVREDFRVDSTKRTAASERSGTNFRPPPPPSEDREPVLPDPSVSQNDPGTDVMAEVDGSHTVGRPDNLNDDETAANPEPEEAMSVGIMEALAKLRKSDG